MFYSCARGMGGVTVGPLLGVLVTMGPTSNIDAMTL
jgi:hypothetical protein